MKKVEGPDEMKSNNSKWPLSSFFHDIVQFNSEFTKWSSRFEKARAGHKARSR
jgi:hypothetical protein